MLVLNTNANGNNGFVGINDFMLKYPDFENSVMLIPIWNSWNIENQISINDLEAVKTINGTKINFWGGNLICPNYWVDATGIEPYLIGRVHSIDGTSPATAEVSCRIGMPEPLLGGEVVGKEIIMGINSMRIAHGGASSTTTTKSGYFKCKVGLLHTDGSITYIDELEWKIDETSGTASVTKDRTFQNGKLKAKTTNGVVASAGDYIIADYILYSVTSSTTTTSSTSDIYTTRVTFGNKYTYDDNARMLPLQISIE